MARLIAWKSNAPTLDEVAELVPDQLKEFVRGTHRNSIAPASIRPLVTLTGSEGGARPTEWTADVVVVDYHYFNHYQNRAENRSLTLLQIVQGGLAGDGWGMSDIYLAERLLSEEEAQEMVGMIRRGLPVLLAGGEL